MSKLLVNLVVAVENLKKIEDEERAARARLFTAAAALGSALRSNGVDVHNIADPVAVADTFKTELKVEAAELTAAAAMLAEAMLKLAAAQKIFEAAIEAVIRDEKIAKESSAYSRLVDLVNPNLPPGPARKRLGGNVR